MKLYTIINYEIKLDFELKNNQIYSIKSLETGFLLDTNHLDSMLYGGKILKKNASETGHKLKLINSFADNVYIIQDLETNFQLDSNEKGDVYLHEINDGDYQRWQLISLYDNVFKLKNKQTQLLLTLMSVSTSNPTTLLTYDYPSRSRWTTRSSSIKPVINYTLKTEKDNGSPQQNWQLLN